MKNKILLLFTFICFSLYSQNDLDKQKIKAFYDYENTKEFLSKLSKNELEREQRILDFLKANNNSLHKRKFKKDNVLYEIFDIIEGKPVFLATDNVNSAKAIKVNHLYSGGSLGLSLSGTGLTVGVWDGGWVLGSHNEFVTGGVSKVVFPDSASPTPVSDFHGTHVAGTVAAKGASPSAKGMAPEANLLSYNWSNDETEAANEAFNNALLISNHSYGVPVLDGEGNLNVPDWYMGCYNTTAQTWDQIAYNYPYYLPVMSGGNSGMDSYSGGLAPGYDKLTGNKNAKNLLIVANANPTINPITGNITNLAINISSSQGPSDDGRIKPDVAADGTNVLSASNASISSYDTASGTSMASPSAAGALLLLQEHYHNLSSNYMRSSTLKGLVCHTAIDDSTIGPDPKFGWGLIDARESAIVLTNSFASTPTTIVDELILNNGEQFEVNVTVNTVQRLKATICWIDLPGADMSGSLNSSTPVLINDLDLRIINSVETTYPWKLQLSDVSLPAVKGDNTVDNVEKVEIDNALGNYTIQVSHKGTLTNGSQAFSLIVSGFDQLVLSNNDFDLYESIVYYPNPTNGLLNISSPNAIINKYEIIDLQGRVVENHLVNNGNNLQINLQSYSEGIYYIKVYTELGIHTKKILKK